MEWLRRIRGHTPNTEAQPNEPTETLERATPGVAAMLEGVGEDRTHAVLDLGSAAEASLRVYSRFASRVRFADLLEGGTLPRGRAAVARAVPAQSERPYDLVLGWDILDRLFPEERAGFVERLVEVTAPNARLHVIVEASEGASTHPLRFSLMNVNRMRCEPVGPPRPGRQPLLPAEVEDVLAPFEVTRAFTLKGGLREYVAIRRDLKRVGVFE